MKKTISITLGARVFTVEEDGYRALDTYLEGLQRHFAQDDSVDELMADIETSLGEKFSEKLGPHKEAVTLQDVEDVIAIMGDVDAIAGDESAQGTHTETPRTETPDREEKAPKHLFRNGDNIVLGGVCSGIAAYFGIDPLIIRLLFIALAFAHGIGLIAYLILWVAVPLAETNAQKLEMRGKPTNIEEIQELVKEKTEPAPGRESPLHRLLNIPIVVIGGVAHALRVVFRAIGPVASIIIGLMVLIGSTLGIAMTNVLAALLLFRVNSPYIASDFPLTELANQPLYYVGVVAAYILALIPLIFLATLGISFIRRKNSFRMGVSAGFIAMWVVAAAIGAFAATDIAPWAYSRAEELEQRATVSKQFEVEAFTGIKTSDTVNITVKQGDAFSVKFTGWENDINALSVRTEKGILIIDQRAEQRRHCIFCFARSLKGEITMPSLTSYAGEDATRAQIEGFNSNLDINLSSVARADINVLGQSVTTTLRDASRLELTGPMDRLTVRTEDISRLDADGIESDWISVTSKDTSHVYLAGHAAYVVADLKDIARLDATDLDVDRADVDTADVSRAEIMPRNQKASSTDDLLLD